MSVGNALSDLVRLAPEKFDPNVVQSLLIQVRRDVIGSSRMPLLEGMPVNIAATDIDQLAATLQHKVTRGRIISIEPAAGPDAFVRQRQPEGNEGARRCGYL